MEKAAYSVAMQPCSHPGGNAVATNNISVLVNKYRRLRHLLVPLDDLCKIVSYIRRWQNFFHSSCAVMLLTLVSLNLSIFLSVVTVSFCVVMAIGYYHQYTSSAFARRLQVLPHVSYINQDQAHEEELQKEQKANEDDLLEFQYLLNKSQEVITTLNGVLEHVYGVALWQHRVQSICVSLFLSTLLVVIYADLLHIVFGCWAIIAFCFNTHFAHSVSDTWKKALESRSVGDAHPVVTTGAIHTAAVTGAQPTMAASAQSAAPASSSSPTAPTSAQATATPSSVRKRQTTPTVPVESSGDMSDGEEVQTSGEGEQGRGKQPGDPPRATIVAQDDEISVAAPFHHTTGEEYLLVKQKSVDSQQESGAAAGLLGKREKEICTRCNVSFTKLLKRRHDCNYCGQLFCGSCTLKVKKYLLGATSPAAYEESVRVCVDCNEQLTQGLRERSRTQASTL